jgi:hypothetical protein
MAAFRDTNSHATRRRPDVRFPPFADIDQSAETFSAWRLLERRDRLPHSGVIPGIKAAGERGRFKPYFRRPGRNPVSMKESIEKL